MGSRTLPCGTPHKISFENLRYLSLSFTYWAVCLSLLIALDYYLPGIFRFFTLLLEIPDKTLHTWKLQKIVLHPSEIIGPKTKTPGNSAQFFLDHPWRFDAVFN